MHLAGTEFSHGYWVDAHSGEIDPELTAIGAEVAGSLPNLGAIIFEIAPDRFSALGVQSFLRQIETLHRLWDTTPALDPLRRPGERQLHFPRQRRRSGNG